MPPAPHLSTGCRPATLPTVLSANSPTRTQAPTPRRFSDSGAALMTALPASTNQRAPVRTTAVPALATRYLVGSRPSSCAARPPVCGCAPRCSCGQRELEEDDDAEQTGSGDTNFDLGHKVIVSNRGAEGDPAVRIILVLHAVVIERVLATWEFVRSRSGDGRIKEVIDGDVLR